MYPGRPVALKSNVEFYTENPSTTQRSTEINLNLMVCGSNYFWLTSLVSPAQPLFGTPHKGQQLLTKKRPEAVRGTATLGRTTCLWVQKRGFDEGEELLILLNGLVRSLVLNRTLLWHSCTEVGINFSASESLSFVTYWVELFPQVDSLAAGTNQFLLASETSFSLQLIENNFTLTCSLSWPSLAHFYRILNRRYSLQLIENTWEKRVQETPCNLSRK